LHKYLRAVGFSKTPTRKEIFNFIQSGLEKPAYRAYTTNDADPDSLLAQFDLPLGKNFGLCVCGQFDDDDEFYPEYYYPYLDTDRISSAEDVTFEKRLDNNSYAGVCDDLRVGVTLIFRLRNYIEYLKNKDRQSQDTENGRIVSSCSLSALSLEGSVLMPIYESEAERKSKKSTEIKRRKLMTQARDGDEEAARTLSSAEMETYANILSHIQYEDVYSMVDSYLMPYGAECDLYSIMAEIKKVRRAGNSLTGEEILILTLSCNGLYLDLAINSKDLFGVPEAGRRFKGIIWMQGKVNFIDQEPAEKEAGNNQETIV